MTYLSDAFSKGKISLTELQERIKSLKVDYQKDASLTTDDIPYNQSENYEHSPLYQRGEKLASLNLISLPVSQVLQ